MGSTFAKPRPMEESDFKAVIDSFVHAAEFSYTAGFDGVQLHAAQYVLSPSFGETSGRNIY
jgi:2,4-dienoyl-CoA reductase-like NADH-dependent reductase (Old Yellow Enzyme family)